MPSCQEYVSAVPKKNIPEFWSSYELDTYTEQIWQSWQLHAAKFLPKVNVLYVQTYFPSAEPNQFYTGTSVSLHVNVFGVGSIDGNFTFSAEHKHLPCKVLLNHPVSVAKH